MNPSNKPLTVLMPVYNAEKYLGESIESVLKQTFTDFEFLIVDDGSTDSSRAIARDYAARDCRIILRENQENLGLVRTLNLGLAQITTPLLARQDADDLSHPQRLEKQVRYLEENPEVALVGSSFELMRSGNVSQDILLPVRYSQIQEILLFGNCFAHGSIVIRTAIFKELGGYNTDAAASHIEDYDAWSRLSTRHRLANLSEVLYSYRAHEESISGKNQPEQFRNTVALSKRLLAEAKTIVSPGIYYFPSENNCSPHLRRNQNLPNLFEAAKLVWKNGRKGGGLWRFLFLAIVQPRFFLKKIRDL